MSTKFNNAEVWSQPNCSACVQAKNLLVQYGIKYDEKLMGAPGSAYTKSDLFERVPHARSVPQIFVDGTYVGGLTELKQLLLSK